MLLKDSELQSQLNSLDDEEKKLLDEEFKVIEELNLISERHRSMTSVSNKVVNNLEQMVKKNLKHLPPSKEGTFDELATKEKEESIISTETLISDYDAFLLVVTERLNEITSTNSKSDFENALKQKGITEYGKNMKPEKISFLKKPNSLLDKTTGSSKLNSTQEYVFDDPEVKNEDKAIQEETDKLIEENKTAINKRREEVKEGLKERKK